MTLCTIAVYQPARCHSDAEYEIMDRKCKELEEAGIIEPSRSS